MALLGAVPVMVDIDPVRFTMWPDALEKAIAAVTARDASLHPLPKAALDVQLAPKAMIPVDLYGQAADYTALLPLAEKHGLLVLEDAAQAFGAEYRGKKTCGLGCSAGATSFFPAKPLGCYGDGGAIFTDDDALAETLRSIRVHGKGDGKYDNVRIGLNARIDTLQAAVLLPKLEIFPQELVARQRVAGWYHDALEAVPGVTPPRIGEGCVSAWAQYCILIDGGKRDAAQAGLKAGGIPSMIYYPKPMHTLKVLAALNHVPGDFPVSMDVADRILALPFHPYMAKADVEAVVFRLKEALA